MRKQLSGPDPVKCYAFVTLSKAEFYLTLPEAMGAYNDQGNDVQGVYLIKGRRFGGIKVKTPLGSPEREAMAARLKKHGLTLAVW